MLFSIPRPPWPPNRGYISNPVVVATLCLQLINPLFVHAFNVDSINQEDHNHPKLLDSTQWQGDFGNVDINLKETRNYEPTFFGIDRSIIGRQQDQPEKLENNVPAASHVLKQGDSHYWTFPAKALLEPLSPSTTPSSKNESVTKDLYVTLATCDQPSPKNSSEEQSAKQLELYVSTSQDNQKPNTTYNTANGSTTRGFLAMNLSVSDDVFFAVAAPSDDDFDGVYEYELTASINAPYTAAYDVSDNGVSNYSLIFVDSDSNSTILVTNWTTKDSGADSPIPYSVFVHREDEFLSPGIQSSLCAFEKKAQFQVNVLSEESDDGFKNVLYNENQKNQQFYVKGLDAGTSYNAVIVLGATAEGDVVRGGGTVGTNLRFSTKSDRNCALLSNLTFCSNVNYAVPANPNIQNQTALASFYDDYAKAVYQNFSKSIQQIPCNTTATAQYSLAKNCTDCAAAYKAWLCAVTIPRCADFSSPLNGWLQSHSVWQNFYNGTSSFSAVNNPSLIDSQITNASWLKSSRRQRIDDIIQPGPWKEVLPCQNLCYNLVQSCPAALGFACPRGKGLENSYGSLRSGSNITCNFPGMLWPSSKARPIKAMISFRMTLTATLASALWALELSL